MTQPTFTVEIAFDADPFDNTPTLVDVTPYVRSVEMHRGRQFELDRVEAATLTLALEDEDRRFDPTNASSPYFPYVLPMRHVRYSVVHNAVTYRRFSGFVEAWPLRWEGGGDRGSVMLELRAVDLFKVLANKRLRSPYAETVLADAPLRYYRCTDNGLRFVDDSGNGSNGYLQGGCSHDDAAAVLDGSDALAFDGTGYAIVLGKASTGLVSGQSFAFEMWVKTSSAATQSFVEVNDGYDAWIQLQAVVGQLAWTVYDDSRANWITLATGTTYNDGAWHHVVGMYDAVTRLVSLYVDNVLKGSATAAVALNYRLTHTTIGAARGLAFVTGAVDEFAIYPSTLSGARIGAHYGARSLRAGELSGARVNYILDRVGWPASPRAIDVGQSAMAAADVDDQTALEALQLVAESEAGVFLVAGDGTPTFLDRHDRATSPKSTPQVTFGDGAGEVEYEAVELSLDDERVFNDVRLVNSDGNGAVLTDAASLATYGPRTLERSAQLYDAAELVDRARFSLNRYRQAKLRCESVALPPVYDDASWAAVLQREIGDRARVIRRPPSGAAIQQDVFVEAVNDSVDGDELHISCQLSPADDWTFWVLGDSVMGVLGTTTVLGF